MSIELAAKIAKCAVNYESSDYGIEFEVDSSREYLGDYFICLTSECGNYDLEIKVCSISVEDDQDLSDETDTDWIWAANFEICIYEDIFYELRFWDSSVKYLWIGLLGEKGFRH